MRVLVLHSDIGSDAPADELDTLIASQAIAETLGGLGHVAVLMPFVATPEGVRVAVSDAGADIVFNMVESVFGQDRLAAMAPDILEKLGIPFTGSTAAAIAAAGNKPLAKRMMRAARLPTPEWSEPPGWDGLKDGTRYIVKSASEDASLGLDDGAVVSGRDAVESRVRSSGVRFGGAWFAEAYIEGREFNVSLIEEDGLLRVLPMPEMRFERWPDARPRIVGYSAKWDEESNESAMTVRTFGLEKDDAGLAAQLADLARKTWRLFDMRGYARVDFRVDREGCPTILEVNPNPCLEPQAGFAAAAGMAGLSYAGLIASILAAATRNRAAGGPIA